MPQLKLMTWTPGGNIINFSPLRKYETTNATIISQLAVPLLDPTGISHHPSRKLFTTCHGDATFISWNTETFEPHWRTVMLPGDRSVTLTAAGQILHGDRETVDEHLVYYYESDDGRIETVTPTRFEQLIEQSVFVPPAE